MLNSQRVELSPREGRRVKITEERLSRCVDGGRQQQYQSRSGKNSMAMGAMRQTGMRRVLLQPQRTTLDSHTLEIQILSSRPKCAM